MDARLEKNGDKGLVRDERRIGRPFHQLARQQLAATLVEVVFRFIPHIGHPIAAR